MFFFYFLLELLRLMWFMASCVNVLPWSVSQSGQVDATPKSCYFQSLFNVYILAHKPYSFWERSLKGIILHVEIESLQQNTNAVAVVTMS